MHSTTKRADGYERRRPEETVLHKVAQRAWPGFVDRCDEVTGGLPKFVRREVVRSAALLLRTRGRRPAVLAVQEVRLR